jgi:beta-phosphoglucomutase-like phosphatase (HAD superfamily)
MTAKAVIWDLDGTLIDSMDQHFEAFRDVLRLFGYDGPDRELYFDVLRGSGKDDEFLRAAMGVDFDRFSKFVIAAKWQLVTFRMLKAITPREHAFEAMTTLAAADVNQAIVTSSEPRVVTAALDAIGVPGLIRTAICSRNHPDRGAALREAAKAVRVPPSECWVVDDLPFTAGVARDQGLNFIGLETDLIPARRFGAEKVVRDLAQVPGALV